MAKCEAAICSTAPLCSNIHLPDALRLLCAKRIPNTRQTRLQDALTHLKAASVATLRTELCVFGEDLCRHLPRTPVTIRIAVSARLQTIIDIKLFERPLAQQRFELVSQVRSLAWPRTCLVRS